MAIIAVYIDYIMNLEENSQKNSADSQAINRWKEFGKHKGVLRI